MSLSTTRTGFRTTSSSRLNWDSPPLRLWRKAKQLGIWDPADIDFEQDCRDWDGFDATERDIILRLTSMFQAGEEAVTLDLLPLIETIASEGRLEEEIYLTSFLWEEAKHVEGFQRFLGEVARVDGDLSQYHTPSYRQMFYEELPKSLSNLREDRSPVAQAEASVTYNLIVEGVLAESGYHAYYEALRAQQMLPGMQTMVGHLKRDESRHLAYGVYLLSRLVAEHGDEVWQTIERRMNELLPIALGMIAELFAEYEVPPFGLEHDHFAEYATVQFQNRFARIERSRNQTLEELQAERVEDEILQ